MTNYLSYQFTDSKEFVDTFDEVPLWSAAFGLLLFKHLELKPDLTVLDIGSGSGFPLLELAERLGKSCQLYGLDPWKNANERARKKIQFYGITNVQIVDGTAEHIPFDSNSLDLIVSNLGINNFEHADTAFQECFRVLKPGGKLALTSNLNGHWKTFYNIFEDTLRQLGKVEWIVQLIEHQAHRGTVASVSKYFTDNGFKMCRYEEDTLEMKFLDGSSFLNHHFVKLGWLSSWRDLIPQEAWQTVFTELEQNLNSFSNKYGGLVLTVPMLFIEGEKE